jgi:3-oxoacyl-[acyl-carrier-protein] synthase I
LTAVSILAAGTVTAVGFNYRTSCAAIRAGIKAIRQLNLWDASTGDYLSGAKVDLPQWWEGIGKLADLVAPPIWECLKAAEPENPANIPVLLGVAALDRPHRLPRLSEDILDEIEWRLSLPHHSRSSVIAMGNVSGVVALAQAREMIKRRLTRYCLIAGVDSFLQQEVVEAYMDQSRIMTKTNSNGFFPGEAGAAVLVGAASGRDDDLKVLGIGFGHEHATIASESPLRGIGMIEACRNALSEAGVAMHEISCRNTDLNGEHYKFKEAMLAQGRLLRQRVERQDVWHAAECIGEIGAAHVPCALAMSRYAGQKDFAPGLRTLCHFSGDGPERAACVVEYAPGGGRA